MIKLSQSLSQWGSDHFKSTLKQELETLPSGSLPLYQATQQGGQVDDSNIAVLINSVEEQDKLICVSIGVFFYEIMGGCNCGDEPPSENTYCDMLLSINKHSGETLCTIL